MCVSAEEAEVLSPNQLPSDPLWPRAGHWITSAGPEGAAGATGADLVLLGVPAHTTSITPTRADATPAAVRDALLRYSTAADASGADVSSLVAVDLGDVADPDGPEGEGRVAEAAAAAAAQAPDSLLVVLGGDNSVTYSVMRGLAGASLPDWGLVTVDAHHDLRDGVSNGSPVRRLLEAGLPGTSVVQIGIAAFSNSPAYAERAREHGITVIERAELRDTAPEAVVSRALEIAGRGGRPVYVDLDVDVCDLAEVPGCPSAAPGGISADLLRRFARLFAADSRVRALDITEIDAARDAADARTVRLAALLVLEAAAGLLDRRETR